PSQSGEIWTSHYWFCESAFYDLFYRPLVTLSYAFNYWPFRSGGGMLQPGSSELAAAQWWFHFVNWALHLVNVLLLYGLARKLFTQYDVWAKPSAPLESEAADARPANARTTTAWPELAGLLGAMMFAVHPIHTEAVTNIVG